MDQAQTQMDYDFPGYKEGEKVRNEKREGVKTQPVFEG